MSPFFKMSLKSRGFSLVELLVSIGIMVAILTVVAFGQRGYTEVSSLTNLADDIAVTISQAQAYGVAVKEVGTGTANFSAGYGVSLSLREAEGKYTYIYFADIGTDPNGAYDGDLSCAAAECLEKISIGRGNYIDEFCEIRTQGVDRCTDARRVDISFKRPETGANLLLINSGGQSYATPNLEGVEIKLKSPGGLTKSVIVYLTGQVSVQ